MSRAAGRRRAGAPRVVLGLTVLALTALVAAGCAEEPAEAYCAAVAEHQAELGRQVGVGGPGALLGALETFDALRDRAPDDIADEWRLLTGRLSALDRALADAGVQPDEYDPEAPPPGAGAAEVAAIEAAADAVGSLETQQALASLEQQARDVCHTPLVL